eukprot:NODE_99_length_20944_cov_0.552746.p5 type:complete len:289 gc:universal NODE_99_length_20944_cov_0.552746:2028-2894(+)
MILCTLSANDQLFVSVCNQVYELDTNYRVIKKLEYDSIVRHLAWLNGLIVSLDNKHCNGVILNKRTTCLTTNDDSLIISDKSGDVYEFNSDGLNLLLGHVSITTQVLVHGNRIYTCDRDRKIRVSHYPNAYNIDYYCLGHLDYVTCIDFIDDFLISGGSESMLYIWQNEDLISKIEIPHGNIRKMLKHQRMLYLLIEDKKMVIRVDFDRRACKIINVSGYPLDCCVFNSSIIVSVQSTLMLHSINIDTLEVLDIDCGFAEYKIEEYPKDLIKPSIDYVNKVLLNDKIQ